jgi:class 3 adenylate cyclase
VNLAARLQGIATGGQIIISDTTRASLGPGIRVSPLGELTVKNRSKTVAAFTVDGHD